MATPTAPDGAVGDKSISASKCLALLPVFLFSPQRLDGVQLRRLHSRHQAKHHADDHGERHGDGAGAHTDGDRRSHDGAEHIGKADTAGHAQNTAQTGQHRRFRQELPENAALLRADGDLPTTV